MPSPNNLQSIEVQFAGGFFPSAPDIASADFIGTIRAGSGVWLRAKGKLEVADGLEEISSTNVGARIFAANLERASIDGGLVGNRLPYAGLLRYANAALFFLSENTSAQVYLNEVAISGLTTSPTAGRLRAAIPDGLGGYDTYDAGFDKVIGFDLVLSIQSSNIPMVGYIGVALARWRSKTNTIGPPSDVDYLTIPPFDPPGAGIRMNALPSMVSGQDGWVFCGTRWDDNSGQIQVVRYIYTQPRGTFTLTNSSTTIAGSGTLWTQDLVVGDRVTFDSDPTDYLIDEVVSDIEAVISSPWGSSTSSGHTMTIIAAQGNWYDSGLRGLVNQNAAKPPRAAGIINYAGRPFLWGVPDTTDPSPTAATGNSILPMLDSNPEHVDLSLGIPTASGSDLVNALPVEGAIFLMTTTGLEVVMFTGDPDTPFKIRVAAEPGFAAGTNGVVDGDVFYGFNGAPLRTRAEGNIDVAFGEAVLDIVKLWNAERVMLAVDPKNRAVLYMYDNGNSTTVLPFMTQFSVWGAPLNFSARILDSQVANGALYVTYYDGVNIRVNEWEGGSGISGSPYVSSQYYDPDSLNRMRLKRISFAGKAGSLKIYAASPDAPVPDVSDPFAATDSFALSDIDKLEPDIYTNIEGKAIAFRIDFPSPDGNLDKLIVRGIPRTELR